MAIMKRIKEGGRAFLNPAFHEDIGTVQWYVKGYPSKDNESYGVEGEMIVADCSRSIALAFNVWSTTGDKMEQIDGRIAKAETIEREARAMKMALKRVKKEMAKEKPKE
jgi:hypothetical protein